MHPAAIVIFDVVQVPFFPAELLAFGTGNRLGGGFHIRDALRAAGRCAFFNRDGEARRFLVLNKIHGLGQQVFIVIGIVVVRFGRGAAAE